MPAVQGTRTKRDDIIRNLRRYDRLPCHAIATIMNIAEDAVREVCSEITTEEYHDAAERLSAQRRPSTRVVQPGDCECHEPARPQRRTLDGESRWYCTSCGGRVRKPYDRYDGVEDFDGCARTREYARRQHEIDFARERGVAENVIEEQQRVTDELNKLYAMRNMASGQVSRSWWTPLLETLGQMHAVVEGLLYSVETFRHENGEPKR